MLLTAYLPACKPPSAPRAKTQTTIAQVYQGIKTLEGEEKQPIKTLIEVNGLTNRDLNTAVSLLLRRVATGPIGFGTNVDQVIDAWGEPLVFVWSDSTDAQSLNFKLRSERKVLLVWSKGPNRLDEKGNGDDVVYLREAPRQ